MNKKKLNIYICARLILKIENIYIEIILTSHLKDINNKNKYNN